MGDITNEARDHQRYTVRMRRLISFAFLAVPAAWPVSAQDQTRSASARVQDRGAHEIVIADRNWDLLGQGYHLTADSTVDKTRQRFTSLTRATTGSENRSGTVASRPGRKTPTAHTASLSARMAACMQGSTTGKRICRFLERRHGISDN